MCSEWGVVPHPLSTGARGWQGLPRLSTQLSPVRVRFQLQVWLLWGQFPPLIFGRTSRAGPGRQRDSCSRCRAGFQGHVLAGAAAVPGRAAIRAQMIRSSSRAPGEFQKAGERLLYFLLRPRRDFLTIPGGTLRSSEWVPGRGGSLGSAPPSASSPLCCQW